MWLKYKIKYVIRWKWFIRDMCYYLLGLNWFLCEFLKDIMVGVVWKTLSHPTHKFTLQVEQKYTSFTVSWPSHIYNTHLLFLLPICGYYNNDESSLIFYKLVVWCIDVLLIVNALPFFIFTTSHSIYNYDTLLLIQPVVLFSSLF